jgi:hypothetical protein
VGDDDDNVVRRSEEGEGGADGDGEGDWEEDEEDEGALTRTIARKRGNVPVLFHARVSSPPSKSSSSEDDSSSMSVKPGPSGGLVSPEAATAVFVRMGRLHIGKMRGGAGAGAGSGSGGCVGEDEGEHGRGGSSWEVP